jgi:hypothetical protein
LRSVECVLCLCGIGAPRTREEFRELLARLGWEVVRDADGREAWCCGRCVQLAAARSGAA